MKGLLLAEACAPSPPLGESWQGDGGRSASRHTSMSNSDSHCQCSASISPLVACSPPTQPACPASHLRAPRLRSAGAVPATATQSLARLGVGGTRGRILASTNLPNVGVAAAGAGCGRPLMPNRLRQRRIPSDARRERDFQDWMSTI